jgi:hypothetical protein
VPSWLCLAACDIGLFVLSVQYDTSDPFLSNALSSFALEEGNIAYVTLAAISRDCSRAVFFSFLYQVSRPAMARHVTLRDLVFIALMAVALAMVAADQKESTQSTGKRERRAVKMNH